MIGKTISHYRVLQKLGQGGMGEVFLADDLSLGRKVALKFLPQDMQQDSDAHKRFLREAKSAAALDHPNICAIHEFGEVDGKDFIVMEYVEGQTLRDRLLKGPLKLKEALQTAAEIAEALERAHEKRIIHRDLKPANIMLSRDGRAKVMDFGLAKQLIPPGGVESQEETITALTKSNTTVGTLAYMSPEQLRGESVDARSDIFSFGVVLYEMLTGRHPFKKSTGMDTASAILKEAPVPLAERLQDAPVQLQHTVKRILAKDPARRYQQAHEIRTDLAEVLEELSGATAGQAGGAPAPRLRLLSVSRWKQAITLILVFLIAAALTSVIVWRLRKPAEIAAPVTRTQLLLPPDHSLDSSIINLALTPNGSHLVYAANNRLFLRDLAKLEISLVHGTEIGHDGARMPFFAPDGIWLGFWMNGQLMKLPLGGGSWVSLCATELPYGASWGVDDTIVFSRGEKGIWRVAASGGQPEEIVSLDASQGEMASSPEILPGGRYVLFTLKAANSGWDDALIVAQRLGSGQRKILLRGANEARYVRTGHLIYTRAGRLYARPFDADRLEATGPEVSVLDSPIRVQGFTGPANSLAFSINAGSLAYVPGGESGSPAGRALMWVDRDGKATQVVKEERNYGYIRLSPDGRRVAAAYAGERRERDLWVSDLRTGVAIPLTRKDDNADPIWTPDGKRLIFSSAKATSATIGGAYADLFWILGDGTAADAQPLLIRGNRNYAMSCSPDGKELLFVRMTPQNDYDIWRLRLDGQGKEQPIMQSEFNELQPMLSPSGRWLVYTSNLTGEREVYVRSYPQLGPPQRISPSGGMEPVWARNEKELFYLEGDRMMAVEIQTDPEFSFKSPRMLFAGNLNVLWWPTYDVAPDGRFLMIREADKAGGETSPHQIILVQNWFEELKRLVPTGK